MALIPSMYPNDYPHQKDCDTFLQCKLIFNRTRRLLSHSHFQSWLLLPTDTTAPFSIRKTPGTYLSVLKDPLQTDGVGFQRAHHPDQPIHSLRGHEGVAYGQPCQAGCNHTPPIYNQERRDKDDHVPQVLTPGSQPAVGVYRAPLALIVNAHQIIRFSNKSGFGSESTNRHGTSHGFSEVREDG